MLPFFPGSFKTLSLLILLPVLALSEEYTLTMAPLRTYISLVSSLAVLVSSHGYLGTIIVDGKTYKGYDPYSGIRNAQATQYAWTTYQVSGGYISPHEYNSPDIICHQNASAGALYIPAKPGSKVTFQWGEWVYGFVHPGPMIDYIAKCNGECASQDKTTLQWVKMDYAGIITGPDGKEHFASDIMEGLNEFGPGGHWNWNITIPNLAPGKYVIRHEIINLYRAGSGAAQNYPQCVNFEISGSGTEQVTGGVPATELYKPNGTGLIWSTGNKGPYPEPGPPLASFTYPE